ncbi:N-acyl homoserine lactonase [Methanobrevibacter woesei]|uniref:N-acyl homoserine lactonase n=1 Tax=Methanobrevibacter woesei TaxID=190976 RepID=A0A2U1S6I2_9EURY|nr:MBL fold metallo-hydrolase [Methanobrevibacter woesei]PWB85737.1 N-acyl homoserine lactonase [Methanobrevibacter woesei]
MNFEDIIFIEGLGVDSNCYLLNKQILVDTGTGQNKDYLYSKLKEQGVNPEDITDIVNTHCHYDHVGGNYLFPNAKVNIHELDANALKNDEDEDNVSFLFNGSLKRHDVDSLLKEGSKILDFEVLHTPGHSKGGICLWDGETLICGDTVFANGGVGRTDIGGDYNQLKESVKRLKELNVKNILPGHGPIVLGNGKKHIEVSYSFL